MKYRPLAWLALGLLLASTAHAEIIHADAVETAGQVNGLALRVLELHQAKAAPVGDSEDLRLKASNVTLEAWYEDSGGTPTPIDPTTERRTVYEGAIEAFQAQGRERHYQFLYADSAAIASTSFVELHPHDESVRAYPNLVARTGAEEEVPLQDTIRAAVPDGTEITVAAPFTLVLWNWNLTFEGSSGQQQAWSGTRPHGAGTNMVAPFGFDSQLLVLRVHNGTLTMPVPAQDLLALHVLVDHANVTGSITTPRSWLPGAPGQAEERIYVGNHSLAASVVNDTVLHVAVEPIKTKVPPLENASHHETQGQVPQPTPAKLDWVPIFAAIVLAAGAVYAMQRSWQWRAVVAAFRGADYSYVAAKAGGFHHTIGVRGRAQAMTMVSALKLGHHQFVLGQLARMKALEPAVAAIFRGHARQGLGLGPEPEDGSRPHHGGNWSEEIDALDSSPAYS